MKASLALAALISLAAANPIIAPPADECACDYMCPKSYPLDCECEAKGIAKCLPNLPDHCPKPKVSKHCQTSSAAGSYPTKIPTGHGPVVFPSGGYHPTGVLPTPHGGYPTALPSGYPGKPENSTSAEGQSCNAYSREGKPKCPEGYRCQALPPRAWGSIDPDPRLGEGKCVKEKENNDDDTEGKSCGGEGSMHPQCPEGFECSWAGIQPIPIADQAGKCRPVKNLPPAQTQPNKPKACGSRGMDECDSGFICDMSEVKDGVADAPGKCVSDVCGGIAGIECPPSYQCTPTMQDSMAPRLQVNDRQGKCTKKPAGGYEKTPKPEIQPAIA